MKSSERFKETIKEYLDNRAANDSLFKSSYDKENKNLDDCITFILNTVKEADVQGWTDDEIYSMAVHYYDEDDIDIGSDLSNIEVVVNHQVQLTEEEIETAKQKAREQVEKEQIANLKKKKRTNTSTADKQQSLF